MKETHLNGKITLTSLGAPTAEDLEKVRALSDGDRSALVNEALERGCNSPVSNKSIEDIWAQARSKAKAKEAKSPHAL